MAEQVAQPWSEIVARSWRDAKFRADLLANPKPALRGCGWPIPDSFTVAVKAGKGPEQIDLWLPDKPSDLGDSDPESSLTPDPCSTSC